MRSVLNLCAAASFRVGEWLIWLIYVKPGVYCTLFYTYFYGLRFSNLAL